MRSGVQDLNTDGNLYKSHDINRAHNRLINYLDHMSLDETFLSTSNNWQKRYSGRELVTQKQAFLRTKEKVDNCRLMDKMRCNLNKDDLLILPENDVRETHAWATHELGGLDKEIYPLAFEAHKRINQFSDWIGVTDRYDGFRRMLNKTDRGLLSCDGVYHPHSGPPMGYIKSASEVVPVRSEPKRWNYPIEIERAKQVDALEPTSILRYKKNTGPGYIDMKSPAEYAGINSVFPGKTEYQRRYTKGKLDINRNPDNTHYTINPNPNYQGNWKLLNFPISYYRTPLTQYQERYRWPDGDRVRIPNLTKITCV